MLHTTFLKALSSGKRKASLVFLFALLFTMPGLLSAAALEPVTLLKPSPDRGHSLMKTLAVKASAATWSDRELSLQDLSDLLWAANGLNRPEERKYTASSALNAHDVRLYVFMKKGVYLYDADKHTLTPVKAGDYRIKIMMQAPKGKPKKTINAPVILVLVSDSTKFPFGSKDQKFEWGAIDTGIVSQNISLFCAATGIKTRPMASMDKDEVRKMLKLSSKQHVFLCHPVGYEQ